MRFYLIHIFFCGLLVVTQVDANQYNICTSEEAIQIEKEVSVLKDWDAIYDAFQRFAHCNDENIVEVWGAYSDVIARLLAWDWANSNRLVTLTLTDQKFEAFIIKHVSDETIPADELRKIIKNVQMHCPKNGKKLCKKIEAAAH